MKEERTSGRPSRGGGGCSFRLPQAARVMSVSAGAHATSASGRPGTAAVSSSPAAWPSSNSSTPLPQHDHRPQTRTLHSHSAVSHHEDCSNRPHRAGLRPAGPVAVAARSGSTPYCMISSLSRLIFTLFGTMAQKTTLPSRHSQESHVRVKDMPSDVLPTCRVPWTTLRSSITSRGKIRLHRRCCPRYLMHRSTC